MIPYRAYFFDCLDHARGAVDLVADTEHEALRLMAELEHQFYAVELWAGERMIYRYVAAIAA